MLESHMLMFRRPLALSDQKHISWRHSPANATKGGLAPRAARETDPMEALASSFIFKKDREESIPEHQTFPQ